jgi:hypothetical protein
MSADAQASILAPDRMDFFVNRQAVWQLGRTDSILILIYAYYL